MASINGLTQASWSALNGIDHAVARVEAAAQRVAGASSDRTGEIPENRQREAIVELVAARRDVLSNAAVLNRVASLDRELLRIPRH